MTAHYCQICEREFRTIATLIKHDCENELVADRDVEVDEDERERIREFVESEHPSPDVLVPDDCGGGEA